MDIYNKGVLFRDIPDKKGVIVRNFYTEKGTEPWTKSKIYKYIVELGPEGYKKVFNEFVNEVKSIPRAEDVLLWMICEEFYPSIMTEELEDSVVRKWTDMILREIVVPIAIRFGSRKPSKRNPTKEDKIVNQHDICMFSVLGSACYILGEDGHFYHIFDKRVEEKPEITERIEANIFSRKDIARFAAINGVRVAFECDIRECMPSKFDPMDLAVIIDWLIKKTDIFGDQRSAEDLVKLLNEKSKNNADKDIVIAVFEYNLDDFEKFFKSHPKLDFVDRGRFEEFENVKGFKEAVGIELSEFFVEPADTGKEAVHAEHAPKTKRDTTPYSLEILNEIDKLHNALKCASSQTKVFNIKPNSVKKRKASVFGNYIAVAAKIESEWVILVDSIKPGSAIYCWHGKKYLDGLEIFKASKTYAREQDDIDHKNHRFDKKPFEIYEKMLKKLGITL